ncbi:hypothetical protein BJV82DRAFT_666361 [Fennellomyces sp. T-0311]|nr:hypothetical protein BJV82DRAFT_666361 [Fennellomyces sp. T-0311]
MTSHETHSTYSNSTGTKASLSSGQNNLKKLKSKHASKLSTLKELFEDWTDEDLLFAIQDADGDLELTIERISAGHAVQWGEVKTKKSKKEAAKAKAAQPTTPLPSAHPPRTQASRHNNERGRVPRGGATPRKTRGKPSTSQQPLQSQAASWGKQTKPIQSTERATGGSWASIASALKTAQPTNDIGTESWNSASATEGWPATNPSSDTNWGAKPSWGEEPANNTPSEQNEISTKSPILTATSSSATTSSAPKTWASLLKSKPAPKPEPKPVVHEEKPANDTWDAPVNTSENDNWNAPVEDNWNAPADDGWNATPAANENNNDPWTQTEQQSSLEPSDTKEDVREEIKEEPESRSKITETLESTEMSNGAPAQVEAANDKEQTASTSTSPPVAAIAADTKVRQPIGRRVRPEEPVVLPNSNTSLAGVDVKFGSLNLDDTTPGVIEANSRLNEHDKKPDQVQVSDKQASTIEPQQNYLNRYAGNAPTVVGQNAGLTTTETLADPTSYLKQQAQQQQQQAVHAQQQSQQQHLGMDHLTSAYNSYLPNQPPTGASGYGINPMGSVPDYGVYGAEAQRAAMGYYDPNTFDHHSPSATSATAYQMRDKYNQDSGNPAGAQSSAPAQGIPQQQVYPNIPYYQYYYMPNHFSTYQQSAYGQPFLNKNMYQMYQTSGKPNNVSANSQYAAAQQAQHLYNQSLSGAGGPSGYDEVASLQHQLGGGANMGLNDYQKPSTYGAGSQIQGFLNNFSGPGQQGAQQAQTAPNSVAAQQGQGKPDANNGPYKPSGPQQPQQQAYQQAMPAPSNYFSHHQPQQMFYPQQVQQYPMQQHMDNTQQQGRQQQYWAQ